MPLSFGGEDSSSYQKKLIEFKHLICPIGTNETFDRLFKLYRGDGQFVPLLLDGSLDEKTIEASLPIYLEKEKWLNEQIEKLQALKKANMLYRKLQQLQHQFFSLIKGQKTLKQNKDIPRNPEPIKMFAKFKIDFNEFIISATHIRSFHYPVNHYELRKEYDVFKNKNDIVSANKIYLFRKIVEDGAQGKDGSMLDLYHRANIDNIHWQFLKSNELDEKLIYDLNDFFQSSKRSLSRSVDWHLERFFEWKNRNKKNIAFYNTLLSDEKIPDELLKSRSKALNDLQSFSMEKMAQTYEFWAEQNIELQKMFVLETILFNEVGNTDLPHNLEKKDVARVVCKREETKKYYSLSDSDPIYKALGEGARKMAKSRGWLNVLFKYGEFSFTHFFMSGNKFIYCSDVSYVGKKLHDDVLKIIKDDPCLNLEDFKALRYFSRAAMIGRIDMEELWTEGYVAQSPAAGPPLTKKKQNQLKKQTLYKITEISTISGQTYTLYTHITNNDLENYLYHPITKQFHYYRNPHFFRYFGPRPAVKKPMYIEQ
jgi:hypothetical protein